MSESKPPSNQPKPPEGAREGKILSRRQFFSIVGWSSFFTSMAGSAFGAYKFFSPSVLYEPPTVFKIGRVEEFGMGVDVRLVKEHQIWVARNERGLYVMIAICRHLGCTPNWLQDVQKFRCPCHGSIYDVYGNVLGDPRRGLYGAPASRSIRRISRSSSTRCLVRTRIPSLLRREGYLWMRKTAKWNPIS